MPVDCATHMAQPVIIASLARGLLYSGLGVEPKKLVAKYCNDFLRTAQKPQMLKKALTAQNISFAGLLRGWRWRLNLQIFHRRCAERLRDEDATPLAVGMPRSLTASIDARHQKFSGLRARVSMPMIWCARETQRAILGVVVGCASRGMCNLRARATLLCFW